MCVWSVKCFKVSNLQCVCFVTRVSDQLQPDSHSSLSLSLPPSLSIERMCSVSRVNFHSFRESLQYRYHTIGQLACIILRTIYFFNTFPSPFRLNLILELSVSLRNNFQAFFFSPFRTTSCRILDEFLQTFQTSKRGRARGSVERRTRVSS